MWSSKTEEKWIKVEKVHIQNTKPILHLISLAENLESVKHY